MEKRIQYIKEKIAFLNIQISEEQAEQLFQYYELLTEWNGFMNLTSITEFEEVVQKHFVDSLSIVREIDFRNIKSLIDIGTGAGFPGLPLKIVFPHLRVTLLDSLNKRIQFLDHVIQKNELEGIETIHGRAEDFAKEERYREMYDLCVSRAVANLSVLSEYCIPYIRNGGYFVSYKSGEIYKELENARSAVFLLGGKIEDYVEFLLPNTDIKRSLVKIKKIRTCPKKYPRKSGVPSKNPL